MEKKCFKCGELKELDSFYKHSKMQDGHLNKCKKCTKLDTSKILAKKISTEEGLELERKRHREKYYRLNYKEKHKPSSDSKKIYMKRYNERFPEKEIARRMSQHIKKEPGMELHHWSYRYEDANDVISLKKEVHYFLHRFIVYDQERMMYRRFDTNELLSTREKHINYLDELLDTKV
jgi:Ribonuclease G/E